MSQTKQQIRDRAANKLGILPKGQALPSVDDAFILQIYAEIYAYLKKKGLATWSSNASVPDELVPYVVSMIAYNCLNEYGVSTERYERIVSDYASAEQNIRELVTVDNVLQTPQTDY